MSEVAEITVQYVNFPREGKKRGSIKSSEGMSFWCPPAMLREFQVGEVCKIEYTTNESGFNQLGKKIGSNGAAPPKQVTRPRANPADSEDILIAVLVKESRFDDWPPTDILNLLQKHRDVVRMFVNVQRRDDMADEIPY